MNPLILVLFALGAAASPASVDVSTATASPLALATSASATCSPTPIPKRTFEFEQDHGVHWFYFTATPAPAFDCPPEKDLCIPQCEAACAADPNCRSFTFSTFNESGTDSGVCLIESPPYNASYWSYDPTRPVPQYTAAYSVTNWSPPKELLPNGEFERGCFDPWTLVRATPNMSAELVPCSKSGADHCPKGKYYAHLHGIPEVKRGSVILSNEPVISSGVNYTLTCYVKGTAGVLDITYNGGNGPELQGTATADWTKVKYIFTGEYGGGVTFNAGTGTKFAAPVDWKISGCKVKPDCCDGENDDD